jgi:hypothetical protein
MASWKGVERGSRVLLAASIFRHKTGRIAGKQFLLLVDHLSNVARRKAEINWKLTEHVKFKQPGCLFHKQVSTFRSGY